jgi:hypothetical protein
MAITKPYGEKISFAEPVRIRKCGTPIRIRDCVCKKATLFSSQLRALRLLQYVRIVPRRKNSQKLPRLRNV